MAKAVVFFVSVYAFLSFSKDAFAGAIHADSSHPYSKSSRFFPSYQSEQAEIGEQLAQELESTLTSIPGVEKARVHISLAPEGIWRSKKNTKSSASVVLTVLDTSDIVAEDIASIVSSASVRLEEDQVTVFIYPVKDIFSGRETRNPSKGQKAEGKTILVVILLLVLSGALGVVAIGIRRMKRGYSSGVSGKVK